MAIIFLCCTASNKCYMLVLWCLPAIFSFWYGHSYIGGGSTVWVCSSATLQSVPMAGICGPCWFMAHKGILSSTPTALSLGTSCYSNSCHPAIQSVWQGIQLWGLSSRPIPPPSLHGREKLFWGLVPPDDTVNSKFMVGIKAGDSGVVMGYQIDDSTHLVSGMFHCLITNFLWVHVQGVNFSQLLTWAVLWGLYLFRPSFWRIWGWTRFHVHKFHGNNRTGCILWWIWCHYFVSLFRAPILSTILIVLNHSWLMTSNLIIYSAMLGYIFCLYHWRAKCQSVKICYFNSSSSIWILGFLFTS